MLGGNCSPCCGCTQGTIDAFYNKVSSADVSLTLAGQTTERNDFTLILYSYFGPSVDASLLPAYVFQKTISPIGTWPLALIPAETFLSNGLAQISFGMTAGQTLHASLTITLQPRVGGQVYGNSEWPGLSDVGSFGSLCKVNTTLTVWQDVVTRKYRAIDIAGTPQQKSGSGNYGASCSLRFFSPEIVSNDVYFDFSFNPVAAPGIWQQDLSAGSQASPLAVYSEFRQRYQPYWNTPWVPPPGTGSAENFLTLNGQPSGGGASDLLVRLEPTPTSPTSGNQISWRTGASEPQLDFSSPFYQPQCPWKITSQASSGTYLLTSASLFGEYPAFTLNHPYNVDPLLIRTPFNTDSVLSPTVLFSFL